MGKHITVNIETCVGCHTCELACAVAHSVSGDLEKAVISGEKPGYRLFVESYKTMPVPIACNHCEEAACILACPTGAAHRKVENGPVFIDKNKCIGCKMCIQACPFGVITLNAEGKSALKCDLCIERQAKGEDPACVSACPTGSLSFSSDDEVGQGKRKKVAEMMATAQQEGQKELKV